MPIIDEEKLRRLVFVAQQRRARYALMHVPTRTETVSMSEDAQKDFKDTLHEAELASITANVALLDYLCECLGMRPGVQWEE